MEASDSSLNACSFRMAPIGVVRTPFAQAEGTPVQGRFSPDTEGQVEMDPAFEEGLRDLAGFSHIILLYVFDRTCGCKLTVTPYLDPEPRGVFATRAPRRPNPIGMTVVRLRSVAGTVLKVSGVDMLDRTPLLDIKPYVPAFDAPGPYRCGWLQPHLERIEAGGAVPPAADGRFHGET